MRPSSELLTRQTWDSLSREWLWVYRGMVPHGAKWSGEIHVPSGIFFVENGAAHLRVDGCEIEVPAGSAYLGAAGIRQQCFVGDTRLLSVGYRAHWPDGSPLFHDGLNSVQPTRKLRSLQEATTTLLRTVHRRTMIPFREATVTAPGSLSSHAQREAAFLTWFTALIATLAKLGIQPMPRRTVRDARVRALVDRLDTWPLEKPLDRRELFDGLAVGPRRLEQLFAAELRIAPAAYLDRRRAESARTLLSEEQHSLKEAAHALGFRHPSHFTLWFRRHTGLAPSAYRQRQREAFA